MKLLYRCPKCQVGQRLAAGVYLTCQGCGKESLLQPEGHDQFCTCVTCKLVRRQTDTKLPKHEWVQVTPLRPTLVHTHICRCGLKRIQDPDTRKPRYHRDTLQVQYHPVCTYETPKS